MWVIMTAFHSCFLVMERETRGSGAFVVFCHCLKGIPWLRLRTSDSSTSPGSSVRVPRMARWSHCETPCLRSEEERNLFQIMTYFGERCRNLRAVGAQQGLRPRGPKQSQRPTTAFATAVGESDEVLVLLLLFDVYRVNSRFI